MSVCHTGRKIESRDQGSAASLGCDVAGFCFTGTSDFLQQNEHQSRKCSVCGSAGQRRGEGKGLAAWAAHLAFV